MSYGNCCVVSDIAENTEVVRDKAIIFKSGDVGDLTDKLTYLLNDPDKVESYRKNARDFICSRHSWDETTNQTIALYRKVTDEDIDGE